MENKVPTLFSEKGIEVRATNKFILLSIGNTAWEYPSRTWAQRRHERLLDQLRKARAVRNWILKIVLRIVGLMLSFALMLVPLWMFREYAHHFPPGLGILMAEVVIIGWLLTLYLTDMIETSWWLIKIKRDGRYY